jgi:hypothetical protein
MMHFLLVNLPIIGHNFSQGFNCTTKLKRLESIPNMNIETLNQFNVDPIGFSFAYIVNSQYKMSVEYASDELMVFWCQNV